MIANINALTNVDAVLISLIGCIISIYTIFIFYKKFQDYSLLCQPVIGFGMLAFSVAGGMTIIAAIIILFFGWLGYIVVGVGYFILYPEILERTLDPNAQIQRKTIFPDCFGGWAGLALIIFLSVIIFGPFVVVLTMFLPISTPAAIIISISVWSFCSVVSFLGIEIIDFIAPKGATARYFSLNTRLNLFFCLVGSWIGLLVLYFSYDDYLKAKVGLPQYN